MDIRKAKKIALDVQGGQNMPQAIMQAAFDRLSEPDQLHSMNSMSLRAVLWNTDKVNLDD